MLRFILLTLAFAAVAPGVTASCHELLADRLAGDLSLSYEEFDQSEGRGFRVLAAAGCHREAARLIERYISANDAGQSSLHWHLAQQLAEAGDAEAAVTAARRTLRPSAATPLRWNDYVLATVAFLQKDMPALQRHRDEVARAVDAHPGNALNLRLLDALIRHFDKDYAYAVAHIE